MDEWQYTKEFREKFTNIGAQDMIQGRGHITMTNRITHALQKLFQKHRIVFWYDDASELRADFDSVDIDGVQKVELANNEFGLKYRMLRECPTQKFLVFKAGEQPADNDNWLLDVQLAHTEFRTDKASLWLTELELPYEFKPIVARHEFFFNSVKRRDQLKASVSKTDGSSQILLKMLGICADSDPRLDSVLENLLEDQAEGGKPKRFDLVGKCGLADFLWERARQAYGYAPMAPTVKDFAIELLKSCYHMDVGGDVNLGSEALVFLKRWKDSRMHEAAFETISNECAELLSIQADLEQQSLTKLAEVDYFRLIDLKILSELATAILSKTMSAGEVKQVIRGRWRGHWYGQFSHMYEAVDYAAEFMSLLDTLAIQLESLEQGVTAYVQSLYRLDQVYRKFIFHSQKAGNATFFEKLTQQICGRYTNSFLLPLCDRWQDLVDELAVWSIPGSRSQANFFDGYVKRILDKNKKVYVIISDAMRFEVGEELSRRIRQEDRFEAELNHMIAKLPSYTQLGMAALLPHKSLVINDDKVPTVGVDGQSSSGTTSRDRILKAATGGVASAVKADDVLSKNREDVRALVRDNDVVYIYHNRIDKTGHTRDTERQAFQAAEDSMDDLLRLVKKLTSANATNVVITADHGFVYQDEVDESDFSQAEVSGSLIATDRRFVIGRDLQVLGAANWYASQALGLGGDLDVAIPKSINRFRKSGSGTRFMHGGSTLQEIVVPVIQIRKRREADVSAVGVDIMPPTTSVISTGQLSVAFYQSDPVTDKVQARVLRVGLYALDGELISDCHELPFDLVSENPRERELKLRLVLSKQADAYNQQTIMLKLQEMVPGTSHYREYKSQQFTLRRSFTSDFD